MNDHSGVKVARPSYVQALGWTAVATIFVQVGATILVQLWPPAQRDIVTLGLWQVVVYAFVIRLFFMTYADALPDHLLALRTNALLMTLLGVLLGVVLQVPAATLVEVMDYIWPTSDAELLERVARISSHSTLRRIAITAVVAGFGPFVEELFFRGALTAALLRHHARIATGVLIAACFAIAHIDPRVWPPLFLVGLVLSYLRQTTGSLWPPIALHAAFNLTTLITVFTDPNPTGRPISLPWPVTALGWGGAALLLTIVHRAAPRKT